MLAFYREYRALPIVPQPVAQLDVQNLRDIHSLVLMPPWSNNFILIEKVKDLKARRWYMEQALAGGWGRDTLESMIRSNAFKRKDRAVTNFATQLPASQGYAII
jgi:predicted nuclease of restriction endonuclease-like (RecB) superfamily